MKSMHHAGVMRIVYDFVMYVVFVSDVVSIARILECVLLGDRVGVRSRCVSGCDLAGVCGVAVRVCSVCFSCINCWHVVSQHVDGGYKQPSSEKVSLLSDLKTVCQCLAECDGTFCCQMRGQCGDIRW